MSPAIRESPESHPIGGLVLAMVRRERVDDEDGFLEVTRVWITEAGKRVLAAREQTKPK